MIVAYATAVFALLVSAFIYWIGPYIYVRTRINPIKRGSLIAFTWCYSALITFFFDGCAYMGSGGASSAGSLTILAIIWGPIFYHRNKKKMLRNRMLILPEPAKADEAVPNQKPPVVEDPVLPAEPQPEPEQPQKPKLVTPVKLSAHPAEAASAAPTMPFVAETPLPTVIRKPPVWLIILIVVLSLLLVGSSFCSVDLYEQLQVAKKEVTDRDSQIKALRNNIDNLKKTSSEKEETKSSYFLRYMASRQRLLEVGYVHDGDSQYHRYDCPVATFGTNYQIHNKSYCEYLGYDPCPYCWDD